MQHALEMRIAHADGVHVLEGVADVLDARAACADALRHESRAPVEVELVHVGRMLGVGDERECADRRTGAELDRHHARLIHAPRHFAARV
jgi:hypothetical protein